MEKRTKYAAALLICILSSILIVGYFNYLVGDGAVAAIADYRISAHNLISLADSGQSTFDRRYLDKIFSVTGVIKDIKKNNSGSYIVSLGGNTSQPSSINCILDSLYNRRPLPLAAGDSCSIRGTCAGHLSDIILVECIIEK
jgi:hypothetical protein